MSAVAAKLGQIGVVFAVLTAVFAVFTFAGDHAFA
jgi:hypothetical protein